MARKTCPTCKRVTGASAATCSGCGHVFDTVAVAPVKATSAKRCVECGLVSPSTARQCQCGFDFEILPEDLPGLLAQRRSTGRAMILGFVLLGVASIVVFFGVIIAEIAARFVSVKLVAVAFAFACAGVAAAVAGCRKGMRILHAVRVNSIQLEARDATMPEARIVR